MNDKQFIETYCQNCGTQRCGGIGTEWFEGCKYKWNHDSYDAASENANRPTTVEGIPDHCTKCKSIDHCIDYAMNYPNGMIRCPCYGSLKLCVKRDKENAKD